MQGICSGYFSFVIPKYLSEFAPLEIRGSVTALFQPISCIGNLGTGVFLLWYPLDGIVDVLIPDPHLFFVLFTVVVPCTLSVIQTALLLTVFRLDPPNILKAQGKFVDLRNQMNKIYKP